MRFQGNLSSSSLQGQQSILSTDESKVIVKAVKGQRPIRFVRFSRALSITKIFHICLLVMSSKFAAVFVSAVVFVHGDELITDGARNPLLYKSLPYSFQL